MRLETPRLLLRPWQDRDRAGFAAINADPEVRRYYYPRILGRAFWRQGHATEIGRACLDAAWARFGLPGVIGYTSAINTPSRRAMERLGLACVAGGDFEDVTVPPGDPLRPHVLYRIARPG
ncbi:MAG: GNAT family N-acetyltransferase [Inquilinus limosus]|uniref:GNAT family N-acetyltransferase n=1 Tax=Inquilinus limosus TaxID=171674 RepID=A0A952FUS9_9PROT|nr:GNAT family N-acetyltransferase [Inquilinus limosus]